MGILSATGKVLTKAGTRVLTKAKGAVTGVKNFVTNHPIISAGAGAYTVGQIYEHSGENAGFTGGAGSKVNEFIQSAQDTFKDLGFTFGPGSVIAAGIAYLGGHFLLESPLLGLGLAAIALPMGQTALDMVTKGFSSLTSGAAKAQQTGPAPAQQKAAAPSAPAPAPVTEISPTLEIVAPNVPNQPVGPKGPQAAVPGASH